jgi:hypothetical protein
LAFRQYSLFFYSSGVRPGLPSYSLDHSYFFFSAPVVLGWLFAELVGLTLMAEMQEEEAEEETCASLLLV